MSIQQQLITLLSGATAAGARIYPLTAPDAVAKPYLTYQRIAANSENALSGNTGLINTRLQLDVYAASYAESVSITAQIDALMAAWPVQNVSGITQDFYEADTKLFRISTDYSIWHP